MSDASRVSTLDASRLDVDLLPGLASSRRRRRRGSKKQPLPPLFDGQHILCPRCRKKSPLLDVEVLPEMPVYAQETVPVLRCPFCRFIFALARETR